MDDERRKKLARFLVRAVPIALVAGILGFWPLPYYVIGPWAAEDLNRVVHVAGASPPPGTMYDTTIIPLPGRPATVIAAKLLPGVEVVPRALLAPPTMSDFDVIRSSYVSQEEGKHSAEIVAARAAGLPFEFKHVFTVGALSPQRHEPQCFKPGDQLVSVDGEPIDAAGTLALAAQAKPLGSPFDIHVVRGGKALRLRCTTAPIDGRARFGIRLGEFEKIGQLPIGVTYTLPWYQSGGSSGLMFALQIYRTLTHADLTHGEGVAGTGVIDDDGNVLPIVGARQKIIAAKRKGATIFLVPMQNYDDIRDTPGVRVIPVSNFNEAVNWLSWRLRSCPNAAVDIASLTGIRFADLPIGDAELNGTKLPAGILRLDYGHAACNLIRFWYFWNDRTHPLRVHFRKSSIRDAELQMVHGTPQIMVTDEHGHTYAKMLARAPDALVGYFISTRPGIALWTSPHTYDYIGFGAQGITLWHAQPTQ
ncbi:MAG TPA: S16 family serine protease [Candidatus Eremiobacteraceae bacterium]|nr:S16 family serine protease [Candidatus Eremiobacteraceae bacterium]